MFFVNDTVVGLLVVKRIFQGRFSMFVGWGGGNMVMGVCFNKT